MAKNKIFEEIEIKIRIPEESLDSFRTKLLGYGFSKTFPRSLELNTLFDYPDRRIYSSGCTVRLRTYGTLHILTWKGPVKPDSQLKIREEIETEVSSREAGMLILKKIGLQPVIEYSKFREKYRSKVKGEVEICIDETKAGNFMEIEGPEEDINHIAVMMGLTGSDYVKDSYVELLMRDETGKEDQNN